jgi:hypothetical protein
MEYLHERVSAGHQGGGDHHPDFETGLASYGAVLGEPVPGSERVVIPQSIHVRQLLVWPH